MPENPGENDPKQFGAGCRFRVSATPNDIVSLFAVIQGIWATVRAMSNLRPRLFRAYWRNCKELRGRTAPVRASLCAAKCQVRTRCSVHYFGTILCRWLSNFVSHTRIL